MPDAQMTIRTVLEELLERRDASTAAIASEAALQEDLGLDSLELAELSAILEEELGTDPYTAGEVPRTVGDVVAFYAR